MSVGTVRWFDTRKGYGFIENDQGKDVFVHFASIESEGYRTLKQGERVEYEQTQGERGLHALHVKRSYLRPFERRALELQNLEREVIQRSNTECPTQTRKAPTRQTPTRQTVAVH